MARTKANHRQHCKMLRYRAWHRGTREMDLLLGPFADAVIDTLSETETEAFESLLEMPDAALHELITQGTGIAAPEQNLLLQKLRAFHGLSA